MTVLPAHANIFSYGTLQLETVQRTLFGRRIEGRDDVLHGFIVTTIEITNPAVLDASGTATHLALVATEGPTDGIAGKIYALSAAELAVADDYEGDEYRRILVPLASGAQAWVYVKA